MRRLNLTRKHWLREAPPAADEYFPGDDCPTEGCHCTITVYHTRHVGAETFRYLKCEACGFLPENKLVESRHDRGCGTP